MMGKKLTAALITFSAIIMAFASPLQAGESSAGTKVGLLTCESVPNTHLNLLIHSTVDVKCQFVSSDRSMIEHYVGETGIGFGLDISHKITDNLIFVVFAADFEQGNHKLAGKYIGVGASATAGAGMGVQLLVGDGKNSVSLEPVIEGTKGLGVSMGITYLYLQAAD